MIAAQAARGKSNNRQAMNADIDGDLAEVTGKNQISSPSTRNVGHANYQSAIAPKPVPNAKKPPVSRFSARKPENSENATIAMIRKETEKSKIILEK